MSIRGGGLGVRGEGWVCSEMATREQRCVSIRRRQARCDQRCLGVNRGV